MATRGRRRNARPRLIDATSCQAVADALCKAHVACVHARLVDEVLYPTYADCMKVEGAVCATQRPSGARPLRPSVAADDFRRCLTSAQHASAEPNGVQGAFRSRAPGGVLRVFCSGTRARLSARRAEAVCAWIRSRRRRMHRLVPDRCRMQSAIRDVRFDASLRGGASSIAGQTEALAPCLEQPTRSVECSDRAVYHLLAPNACGRTFFLCRACNRGQKYCSRACAREARRIYLRPVRARHQAEDPEGHAARQRDYRRRRRGCVTDQSSAHPVVTGTLRAGAERPASAGVKRSEGANERDVHRTRIANVDRPLGVTCHHCGTVVRIFHYVV